MSEIKVGSCDTEGALEKQCVIQLPNTAEPLTAFFLEGYTEDLAKRECDERGGSFFQTSLIGSGGEGATTTSGSSAGGDDSIGLEGTTEYRNPTTIEFQLHSSEGPQSSVVEGEFTAYGQETTDSIIIEMDGTFRVKKDHEALFEFACTDARAEYLVGETDGLVTFADSLDQTSCSENGVAGRGLFVGIQTDPVYLTVTSSGDFNILYRPIEGYELEFLIPSQP